MSQRRSAPITQTVINALQPGDIVHDTRLSGFGARRQKDAVSYFLKTRINGRQRWFTIGRHGHPWTPETARKQAVCIMADPTVAEPPVPVSQPARLTVALVAEEFLANHGPKLKPRTLPDYRWLIRDYLVPALGTKLITEVTRAHVSAAHATWSKVPRTANLALTVLSKLMTWSEDQGYRPENTNPVSKVQRYRENRRERYLTPEELARLGAALEQADATLLTSPYVTAALRLLILTGARLSEITTLEWAHVDLTRRMIFLPDSKTGSKPLTLNNAAIDVLASIPKVTKNPYVIVGHRTGQHLVNIQKPWRRIRALAGLDALHIHDLRHTFASVAVAHGGSLPVLGRQLGHSQPQTTQRYAHLADDPVRKLTETTGQVLAEALAGVRHKTP